MPAREKNPADFGKLEASIIQKGRNYLRRSRRARSTRSPFSTSVLTLLTLRESSGKLCAGVPKIWLFEPHSACFFIQYFLLLLYLLHGEVSCSFGITTEETEPLKNFQVPKTLVVAVEQIPLNVHRFETSICLIVDGVHQLRRLMRF